MRRASVGSGEAVVDLLITSQKVLIPVLHPFILYVILVQLANANLLSVRQY